MTEEVSWDEALTSAGYVNLVEDTEKKLRITNWKLVRTEKFDKEVVEFQSDCILEDGKKVEKQFTTASNRLKTKLKAILADRKATEVVDLSILKVGEKFNTNYSVKEIKG